MLDNILFWLYVNLPFSWRYRSYLSKIACPDNDRLHFHHDGCTSCSDLAYEALLYGYHSGSEVDDDGKYTIGDKQYYQE